MRTKFSTKPNKQSDVLAIAMPAIDGELTPEEGTSSELSDLINHNVACDANFQGKVGQTLSFAAPKDSQYKKVVLLGLGGAKLKKSALKAGGKALYNALKATGYENADICIGSSDNAKMSDAEASAILADAVHAASYSFDKYITDERAAIKQPQKLNFMTSNVKEAKTRFAKLDAVTQGEFLAADMGNEPGNAIYPKSAAKLIQKELGKLPGVTVKIIDAKEMKKEKMHAALAVGQGSVNEPCMVVIEYDGTNGNTKDWPIALVGKGVTFDSGGISLKPGAGMEEMKMDMCGAAAVVGAMRSLAGRKANTKVVAICGFAENMPDGKSYRPGDVIKTRAGKTVNVGNTDAEGRLVLCDAMDYIQDKYQPKTMLDLATLTGAMLMTGAHSLSGVFTNEKKLWKKLEKAGDKSGQPGWRMPMIQVFADAVKGKVTDLSNTGSMRWGGSSTAAKFLEAFVKASTDWAHLDIAGTAIPANGIANGHGVRWLDQFIADNYENKSAPAPEQKSPKIK